VETPRSLFGRTRVWILADSCHLPTTTPPTHPPPTTTPPLPCSTSAHPIHPPTLGLLRWPRLPEGTGCSGSYTCPLSNCLSQNLSQLDLVSTRAHRRLERLGIVNLHSAVCNWIFVSFCTRAPQHPVSTRTMHSRRGSRVRARATRPATACAGECFVTRPPSPWVRRGLRRPTRKPKQTTARARANTPPFVAKLASGCRRM